MDKNWGNIQVDKELYFSKRYLNKARFNGLFGQVNLCLTHALTGNILEIGPGPGLFSVIMKKIGFNVTTVDFDKNLKPDLLSRLPNLPINSKVFDMVCAFEVLEHMPLELVNASLSEMARLSNSYVCISVPDVSKINPKFKLFIDLKLYKWNYRKEIIRCRQSKLTNPKEHYWELGINGINEDYLITEAKNVGLDIVANNFIEPWFHFFAFEKHE